MAEDRARSARSINLSDHYCLTRGRRVVDDRARGSARSYLNYLTTSGELLVAEVAEDRARGARSINLSDHYCLTRGRRVVDGRARGSARSYLNYLTTTGEPLVAEVAEDRARSARSINLSDRYCLTRGRRVVDERARSARSDRLTYPTPTA